LRRHNDYWSLHVDREVYLNSSYPYDLYNITP
jgi:hypothetical protein